VACTINSTVEGSVDAPPTLPAIFGFATLTFATPTSVFAVFRLLLKGCNLFSSCQREMPKSRWATWQRLCRRQATTFTLRFFVLSAIGRCPIALRREITNESEKLSRRHSSRRMLYHDVHDA
jgi:hypothetical protein